MKIKLIKSNKTAGNTEISNDIPEDVSRFIGELSLKVGEGSATFYKQNENYVIYTFNEKVSFSNDTLSQIASFPKPVFLSVLGGQLALFIYKI